jgi:hypothetical protein
VIATGRSLPELRERCDAYGLAGGIAEYGAFVWNGRAASLLAPDAADALGAVRTTLAREPSVVVDEGFAGSVRAYSRGHNGSRGPLGAEQERAALAVAPGVTAIRGDLQTDFVAGVDKGAGLLELTRLLDAPVVFAIGDAEADLPMLALAEHAYAPAAASPALRAEARVVRHEYQAGLLDAVAAFLGHRPERCRVCAPPRLPPEGRLIAAALRAKDGGAFVKLFQLARVAFDQRLSTTSR